MPSVADRSPAVLSSPSSGRRILSRITSPFAPKSRNIAEFLIEPDDPHKHYSPGDVVTGLVRFRVARATRLTHLVLCLHGYAQVYKNPGSPGEGFRAHGGGYLGAARGKKPGVHYYGNGFAPLFENELLLCGEGRVDEGEYKFGFALEFPDSDLPSSVDFDRGTISYLLTTTMTRPTTILPVISHDRKIKFVERIDISTLPPPKSRTITLAPLTKRTRARTQARKLVDPVEKTRKTESAQQGSDQPRPSEHSSTPSSGGDSETPVSRAQSEISFGSAMSSQARTSQLDSQRRDSPSTGDTEKYGNSKAAIADKVITATIELESGGFLRGDSINVKVDVTHTKPVKSLCGVIVTLFREARVDMRASGPLDPVDKSKGSRSEDYYPKSITGFGGLSLSGAGSNHMFRKYFKQSIAPLIVDPQTLTAEVNAKVRVPEVGFGTISTVPGGIISFKYFVEVLVDIQGKLVGLDRSLGSFGGNSPILGEENGEGRDTERSAFASFGSTIIDTVPIRRDKGVVATTFEVIIGTQASERKGKRRMEAFAEPELPHAPVRHEQPEQTHGAYQGEDWYDIGVPYDSEWYEDQHGYQYYDGHGQYHVVYPDQRYNEPAPPVPIPPIQDESQMTEKERIQHAETRLLPSQPPGVGEQDEHATAPYLPDEAGSSSAFGMPHVEVPYLVSASGSVIPIGDETPRQLSGAPEYAPPQGGSSARVLGEDQQELQRQLLHTKASAPPTDDTNGAGPSSRVDDEEPSAPTLDEADSVPHDLHDSHAHAAAASDLPRYEQQQ